MSRLSSSYVTTLTFTAIAAAQLFVNAPIARLFLCGAHADSGDDNDGVRRGTSSSAPMKPAGDGQLPRLPVAPIRRFRKRSPLRPFSAPVATIVTWCRLQSVKQHTGPFSTFPGLFAYRFFPGDKRSGLLTSTNLNPLGDNRRLFVTDKLSSWWLAGTISAQLGRPYRARRRDRKKTPHSSLTNVER